MPFKSKAQRRKFAQLLVEGEITPEVYEEWNRETGSAQLPDRVKKKARRKPSPSRKRKSRPSTTRAKTRRSSTPKKRTTTRKQASKRSSR
jgi:hypothetical protein